jgi:hypothetical protein
VTRRPAGTQRAMVRTVRGGRPILGRYDRPRPQQPAASRTNRSSPKDSSVTSERRRAPPRQRDHPGAGVRTSPMSLTQSRDAGEAGEGKRSSEEAPGQSTENLPAQHQCPAVQGFDTIVSPVASEARAVMGRVRSKPLSRNCSAGTIVWLLSCGPTGSGRFIPGSAVLMRTM